jgi:hypothetical protein
MMRPSAYGTTLLPANCCVSEIPGLHNGSLCLGLSKLYFSKLANNLYDWILFVCFLFA